MVHPEGISRVFISKKRECPSGHPLFFYYNDDGMKRYVLLFSLIVFYADVFPQAVEAGFGRGDVLKIDSWLINDALKQQEANT